MSKLRNVSENTDSHGLSCLVMSWLGFKRSIRATHSALAGVNE